MMETKKRNVGQPPIWGKGVPKKKFQQILKLKTCIEIEAESKRRGIKPAVLITEIWEKAMQQSEHNIYQQWLDDVKNLGEHAYKSWRYQHLISGLTSEFSGNRQAEMMFDEYDSAIRIFRVQS
jgi:hypothetical protein